MNKNIALPSDMTLNKTPAIISAKTTAEITMLGLVMSSLLKRVLNGVNLLSLIAFNELIVISIHYHVMSFWSISQQK